MAAVLQGQVLVLALLYSPFQTMTSAAAQPYWPFGVATAAAAAAAGTICDSINGRRHRSSGAIQQAAVADIRAGSNRSQTQTSSGTPANKSRQL
jgi:hypothetical protein